MAPADFEHVAAFTNSHHVVTRIGPLDCGNVFFRDQGIAMDAQEVGRELLGQRLERFIDQALAAFVAHGHVFLIGIEIINVLQRNQLERFAQARADLFTAMLDARGLGDLDQAVRRNAGRVT